MTWALMALPVILGGGYLYWRYVWFFRNPQRQPPAGENIVSPADGTVVYVTLVKPGEEVVTIKQGVRAKVEDILREEQEDAKVHIGIFMSPFSVHYNRVPLAGRVEFIKHHPPLRKNYHMGPMHWRTLFSKSPLYRHSLHIVGNERTVTKVTGEFQGKEVPYYVIQIAGKSVRGIDSYTRPGAAVDKGAVFGMIRIGSQVDLVLPHQPGMKILAQPGDRVRAGETILIA
ncbi:MAG: phosphatidylserine decarboxylase [Thermodesulfobacteriota bacterium]